MGVGLSKCVYNESFTYQFEEKKAVCCVTHHHITFSLDSKGGSSSQAANIVTTFSIIAYIYRQ